MNKIKEPSYRAFFESLERSGFSEGDNLIVERFNGGGIAQNYKRVGEDAVNSKPDVVFVISDRMTKIVKDITDRIPIVAATSDPVSYGLANSLSHPGGNVTGIMVNSSPEIFKKRIEYLKEIVPDVRGIFQLTSRTLWESPLGSSIRVAVEQSGLQLIGPPVESPHREADYRAALLEARKHTHVTLVTTAVENFTKKELIVKLINEFQMVAFYPHREYIDVGGLIAHDVDQQNLFSRLGMQVAAVLKGETVGDIPFYQPLRLRLVVNLAAANAAGITLPASLVARADEVVE